MMADIPVADGAAVSAAVDASLDEADRGILALIQSGFPIVSRPYAVIGERAGMSEEEALERVRSLKKRGVIRRIGANFQSGKIGYRSTLCGAKVPEDKLELFIETVNAESGVTHNYLRDHEYNVWFTCIGPSDEDIARVLRHIADKTGVRPENWPARRMYKIKVDFRMDE